MNEKKKIIIKIKDSVVEINKEPDHNADGSWDEHNCYVEKCEFCSEEPCICGGDV